MNLRKNILLVTSSFPPEPIVAAHICEEIARRLSEEFNVTVLCPPPTRPLGTVFPPRLTSALLPYRIVETHTFACPSPSVTGRLKESWHFGKAVAAYLHEHASEIDAIYAYPWPTVGQYLMLREARKCRIPTVTHIQDLYPESLLGKKGLLGKLATPLMVAIDRREMRYADKLIAISPQMRSTLVKTRRINRENVVMARNWQDFSLFLNTNKEYPEKFTFMFVGSLSPSANVPLLIRAFARADIPGSRFVIGGNGSHREACLAEAALHPGADIQFVEVTPQTTPDLQASASVLVLALRRNVAMTATPSKLVAYMYSGRPVIGSLDLGSDADMIIQESGGGEFVDAENEEALAQLMRKYARTPVRRLRQIGDNARRYAIQNFRRESNLKVIVDTIRELAL